MGDEAFMLGSMQGSVECMARHPRTIFATAEATAVMDSARAVLDELPEERLLSVDAAWCLMREDTWEEQRRSETITRLVTSLRIAHGHCATAVLWPTPQQYRLDQERRALASGRNRDGGGPGRDRNGGGNGRDRRGSGGSSGPLLALEWGRQLGWRQRQGWRRPPPQRRRRRRLWRWRKRSEQRILREGEPAQGGSPPLL